MATKRIDIVVHNDQVSVKPIQGYCQIKHLEGGDILVVTGSWKIVISPESIFINCSSKAIKKQNKFKIATMNGSLFLYNSTNNWYWYFRKKKLQFVLDMHKIDSVKMCTHNSVELPCCMSSKNGILSESTLEKNPTLKYYGENASVKLDKKHMVFDDEENTVVATVVFTFSKFLLVEFLPNHRKLYVDKDYRIEQLFTEGNFDDIEVKSVVEDLQVKG